LSLNFNTTCDRIKATERMPRSVAFCNGGEKMICTLCPRMCHAERNAELGDGYCRMSATAMVSRIAPHMWEEPCISGTKGCGTVFFAGCSLGCVYCQNHEISHLRQGMRISDEELAQRIYDLEQTGVHNIAFVTGTHFIPNMVQAQNWIHQAGKSVSMVVNE